MTTIAKIQVTEEDCIRRYLYPMTVEIRNKGFRPEDITIRDEEDNLIPCEAFAVDKKLLLFFALSLSPLERKWLKVVTSTEKAPIPDPIAGDFMPDGSIVNRQERVSTKLSEGLSFTSVLYDGVQHLAGPTVFCLDGIPASDMPLNTQVHSGALTFLGCASHKYEEQGVLATTCVTLTACKSWTNMTHEVLRAEPGSVISLTVPLSPGAEHEIPICDFGLGNGAYSKIDGEAVVLEVNALEGSPYYSWRIGRDNEGIARIDYCGMAEDALTLEENLWFHWTLRDRSLAAAITELPKGWSHLQVRLGRFGGIQIAVILGSKAPKRARLGVCLHFLNSIPAIAAATNPASILRPPHLKIDGH